MPLPRPAPRSWSSVTPTAACCRLGGRDRRARRRHGVRSASTATTTPAAPSPTPWPRSTPVPCTSRAPSTATASGPATPTWSPSSPTSNSSTAGRCCRPDALREATRLSHAIAEVTNVPPSARQPYVGLSSFAHKAGLHASAIKVDPNLYQHIDPARVGNDMRMLVSDMAGRANIQIKGERARLRPLRPRAGGEDHREGEGSGGGRLHLRGRGRQLRAAAAPGARAAAGVLRGAVLAGVHPVPAPTGRRRPTPSAPSTDGQGAEPAGRWARATDRSTPSTTPS